MCVQGCQPELRVEVWPYLLRLHSPSASQEQRRKLRAELSRGYVKLLQRCQASTPNQPSQAQTFELRMCDVQISREGCPPWLPSNMLLLTCER
jgi:hypothetical protein